jgi:hypothetical protein
MTYGFVYMLMNEHMPNIVKIGCTERSPRLRADELSKGTGVPGPFSVVCYIEVSDHQRTERQIHGWLAEHRVSENREFFYSKGREEFLVGLFYWHEEVLSFSEPNVEGVFIGTHAQMVRNPLRKESPAASPGTEASQGADLKLVSSDAETAA